MTKEKILDIVFDKLKEILEEKSNQEQIIFNNLNDDTAPIVNKAKEKLRNLALEFEELKKLLLVPIFERLNNITLDDIENYKKYLYSELESKEKLKAELSLELDQRKKDSELENKDRIDFILNKLDSLNVEILDLRLHYDHLVKNINDIILFRDYLLHKFDLKKEFDSYIFNINGGDIYKANDYVALKLLDNPELLVSLKNMCNDYRKEKSVLIEESVEFPVCLKGISFVNMCGISEMKGAKYSFGLLNSFYHTGIQKITPSNIVRFNNYVEELDSLVEKFGDVKYKCNDIFNDLKKFQEINSISNNYKDKFNLLSYLIEKYNIIFKTPYLNSVSTLEYYAEQLEYDNKSLIKTKQKRDSINYNLKEFNKLYSYVSECVIREIIMELWLKLKVFGYDIFMLLDENTRIYFNEYFNFRNMDEFINTFLNSEVDVNKRVETIITAIKLLKSNCKAAIDTVVSYKKLKDDKLLRLDQTVREMAVATYEETGAITKEKGNIGIEYINNVIKHSFRDDMTIMEVLIRQKRRDIIKSIKVERDSINSSINLESLGIIKKQLDDSLENISIHKIS